MRSCSTSFWVILPIDIIRWRGWEVSLLLRAAGRQGEGVWRSWAMEVGLPLAAPPRWRALAGYCNALVDDCHSRWMLKTTFSARGLARAAGEVNAVLGRDDLPEARRLLAWHLVSRDTSALSQSHVCAATIESVAENLSDGVVAPLFYYSLGGLPAALAYRFINTGDAMLGYHDEEREWLGKVPARLDDVANVVPARVSAFVLLLAAGKDFQRGWRVWRRDRGSTESPNAGHPMSAMAGLLGVELEKHGHYRLGSGQRAPTPHDVARSIHVMKIAAVLVAIAGVALACLGRKHHELYFAAAIRTICARTSASWRI